MSDFEDGYWQSQDGLKLHYRDYPGDPAKTPVMCLHGLTRNARDFANLADHIAGGRRVIVPEMRGRGESEYAKDSTTYDAMQYVEDVTVLLDELAIERFVSIGTSMGGLMTFAMAMTAPDRLAGAAINDVGPKIEPEGLARIGEYVGQGRTFETWVHAARALEETQGGAHPAFELADWVDVAKRLMSVTATGRIVFDYDMKIAEPFADFDPAAQPELWPALEGLAGKPVLVIRGGLSDLFSAATLDRMIAMLPNSEGVTIANVGHAPTLDEPDAVAAIDRLLAKIA